MEFWHPRHPHHPLFLSDEAKFRHKCSICKRRLGGKPCYVCVECKYYVHKSCAQLPLQIQQHPFHPPDHPLSLCSGEDFTCDSCHKTFRNELSFSCSVCDFDLDVKCALTSDIDTEGKEFIRHFTHQHPLTICSEDGDNPPLHYCFACKKTTSDLIYGCTPCDYFLHKSCAEIPTHVLHSMHPQHALSLVVKWGRCNYCQIDNHTWKYYCISCEFFLDVSCWIESAKDDQNSEISCFFCGKQHLDSNSCIDSLYFINQSCIQLPEAIELEFHSHKPLLLLGTKDFACDSCHKWFDKRSHYGCEECNFRMDVKCALMPSIQNEERDESICPVIPHHFKHQHPLQLIREVYDINCSACHASKLSPIYGCIKCEYFLHQSCLELPNQIQHPLHESHELILQPLRHNFCQICCRKYDGFAFGCIQCLFFVGIECIFVRGPFLTVKYKYHPHRLYLIEKSYCDHCNSVEIFCQFSKKSSEFNLTESYSFRCIQCDYNLHFLCGPLPCTIKHQSHVHALKLMDSVVEEEDDSDEHYCDICEEIRNARLCVYYCEDCKFFAHVHCVISEIINLFKKNPKKVKFKIVGDLTPEHTINSSHYNLTGELLLHLLIHLDENDMSQLRLYFPHAELFPREEDKSKRLLQNPSSEDDTRNIIKEELSFYNDGISLKIEERLGRFKPYTKYHIEPDECQLPVVEIKDHKVTSNFAPLFRALLMKYRDFFIKSKSLQNILVCDSKLSKNGNSVVLYFLCRMLESMHTTFVVDITEKQLFTWLYYLRGISDCGIDLTFLKPFLERIKISYFGLKAMKFEDEAPGRIDYEIVNLEQKIYDIKTQIEELKWHRQQHWVGKIAEESAVMSKFFSEAKKLKWSRASEGIF